MPDREAFTLSRHPSPSVIQAEHLISLVDHTALTAPQTRDTDAEQSDSDAPTAPSAHGPAAGLSKRLTNNSLRQTVRHQYTKQKYSKYSRDRYNVHDSTPNSDEDTPQAPQVEDEATPAQRGYLERAHSKAKDLLRRKKTLGKGDKEDIVVDTLYENQRGVFLFGIPKYSSASLLPSDPRPWQNAQFRTSAVDIRNAQVPDPSWEWIWKSWYVDMSRDVDEEGWEYSFAFVRRAGATFAWHGNHPWFHSFVRRRRWLRMRKRKNLAHNFREKGHELAEDYFTIHPEPTNPTTLMRTRSASSTLAQNLASDKRPVLEIEKMEISSISDLFLALRKCTIDREKLFAVNKFTDESGEELYYLKERMDEVLDMLMYQSSRRQLLNDLVARYGQTIESQRELAAHHHLQDDSAEAQHSRAVRHADNLLGAVRAAHEQVKRLEYWSDMKDITDAASRVEQHGFHAESSFTNKQPARESVGALQKDPLSGYDSNINNCFDDMTAKDPSKTSSKFFEPTPKLPRYKGGAGEEDSDKDQYIEEAYRSKGKEKAKALDGVSEAPEGEWTGQAAISHMDKRLSGRGVQVKFPVAEPTEGVQGDPEPKHGGSAVN